MSNLSIEVFLSLDNSDLSFNRLRDYLSFLSRAALKQLGRTEPASERQANKRLTELNRVVEDINGLFRDHVRDGINYRKAITQYLLANQDLSNSIPVGRKMISATYNPAERCFEIRATQPNYANGLLITRLYSAEDRTDLLNAVINNDLIDYRNAYQEGRRQRQRIDDSINEFGDDLDEHPPSMNSLIEQSNRMLDLDPEFRGWDDIVEEVFTRLFPRFSDPRRNDQDVFYMFLLGSIFGINLVNGGTMKIPKGELQYYSLNHDIGAGMLGFFICGILFGFAYIIGRRRITYTWISRRPIRIEIDLTDETNTSEIFPNVEITQDIVDSLLRSPLIYYKVMDKLHQVSNRELYNTRVADLDWTAVVIRRIEDLVTRYNPFMLVSGNNSFWEYLFYDAENGYRNQNFYRDCWKSMILIPSEILKDGRVQKINGCFVRAVLCSCKPTTDKPMICNCQTENAQGLTIAQVAEMCAQLNQDVCSYLVILILISSRQQNEINNKRIDVLYISPNFYENPNRKVLLINAPEWLHVRAHCAVWIPALYPKSTSKDEAFNTFCNVGDYNSFLHKLTKRKESVCPICGNIFIWSQNVSHFNTHRYQNVCSSCGLHFDSVEELEIHRQYHCKQLIEGSCISFPDTKLIEYKEKILEDVTIVYADLESAIDENGKHTTILCGWATANDGFSYRDNIGRMLACWRGYPTKKVLIYFHNGENYDFHFIIEALSALTNVRSFNITADSSEKIRYFDVTYGSGEEEKIFMFRDSFSYVSTSLEKWVKVTPKEAFKIFRRTFPAWKAEILLQKNPFPYNMIQQASDLDEPFDKIIDACDADNRRFLFCYKYEDSEFEEIKDFLIMAQMQCKWRTVKDYYVDYLKCDVTQLADCMEYFHQCVKDEYDIDIHSYYGAPSLSWAAWLKQNKYEIDLIEDSAQFDIINSSIRGGQCGAMTRYYNQEEEPDTFVADLDANSLYATVMLKYPFPCNDWKWDYPEPDSLFTWLKLLHRKGRSGFIEVDLTIVDNPEFYSYVPIAQKRSLSDIYDYQAMYDLCAANGENVKSVRFSGLTQTMGDIKHYCAHTRLMEWYLSRNVVRVNKIYRVLHGHEEYVFRDYVKHNLDKRKEFSDNPVKKMLYKLLNNSLYGKTYEDVTARTEYGLVPPNIWAKLEGDEVKRDIMEFSSKWHLYEKYKYNHQIKRPIFLGAAITEYSKLWMYIFFYDKVRPAWPNSEVLYTDTDALTIKFSPLQDELDSQDGSQYYKKITSFQDLAELLNTPSEQLIDTSNFSVLPVEPYHTSNNGSPGLFKSETGDAHIVKMIALRAKTYIMLCSDGSVKMSIKGCPMNEKKKITYEDFKYVLDNPGTSKVIEFDAIRSKYHIVKSVKIEKIVLSGDDRKRFICNDFIHTYPFFSSAHLQLSAIYETGLIIK